MDNRKEWFYDLFKVEENEKHIKTDFSVSNHSLYSKNSGDAFEIGELLFYSLDYIRRESRKVLNNVKETFKDKGFKVRLLKRDIYKIHSSKENENALIQVSGNFSCLQYNTKITDYIDDYKQCNQSFIATAPATLYRRYFHGKINLLEEMEKNSKIGKNFWEFKNGLIEMKGDKLVELNNILDNNEELIRNLVRIGYHHNMEVVYSSEFNIMNEGNYKYNIHKINHSLCSPLDLRINKDKINLIKLSRLILEAQYEATLWAGVINAYRNNCNKVILVILGFQEHNNIKVIQDSLLRAINIFKTRNIPLDITINFDFHNDNEKEMLFDNLNKELKPIITSKTVISSKTTKTSKTIQKNIKTKKTKTPSKTKQTENREKILKDMEEIKNLVMIFKKKGIKNKSFYNKSLMNSLVRISNLLKTMNNDIINS